MLPIPMKEIEQNQHVSGTRTKHLQPEVDRVMPKQEKKIADVIHTEKLNTNTHIMV